MILDYAERPSYAQPLAIMCIAAGILLCIEGYRIHRIGAFISALFIVGDYVVSIISLGDETYTNDIGQYYATFFAAGAIVGAIALIHARASSVVTGFCAGVVMIDVILSMANYRGTLGLYVALLSVCGVIGAAATAVTKKPGVVVATSVVGADGVITGVRYIVFAAIYKDNRRSRSLSDDLNSAWWTLCAIEIVLAVVAIPLQLLLTARNVDHEHDNRNSRDSRGSNSQDDRETVAPYRQQQQQHDTQSYNSQPYNAPYNASSYSRESQPPTGYASRGSSGTAQFAASTDHHYDQHPYNSVQTPQQRQQDGKSSYVTGTNAISHV